MNLKDKCSFVLITEEPDKNQNCFIVQETQQTVRRPFNSSRKRLYSTVYDDTKFKLQELLFRMQGACYTMA